MRTALFWVIMQRVVVISYRCFRTTYQSHLQASRNPNFLPLKIGLIGCPVTLVRNYNYLLC